VATILKQGSRGSAVRDLQSKLRQLGYNISVDGIYGPQTAAAVRDFQRKYGLAVDGIAGPQTLSKLNQVLSGSKQATTSASTGLLRRGSQGAAVRDLQNKLRQLGYNIAVDGIFGPQTEAAVKDFQKKYGLTVDGIVGPQTLGKLNEVLSKPQPPQQQPLGQWLHPEVAEAYQRLQQTVTSAPTYQMPSEDELRTLAREYASLIIDPQRAALQRSMEEQERQAALARLNIESAYAAVLPAMERLIEQTRQQTLRGMQARGLGRSDLVEYSVAQTLEPLRDRYAAMVAERATRLADIETSLEQARRQYQQQLQALETQRGQLTAQQLASLRDLAYARATGDWQRALEAQRGLLQSATALAQAPWEYGMTLLPIVQQYTTLTPQQLADLVLRASELLGKGVQVPDWQR